MTLIAIIAVVIFALAILAILVSIGGSLIKIAEALEAQNTHYEIGAKDPDGD